ncbi:matrixin family metalloprotease [Nodularia spumigena]|nr:matrixin family metalloprotease [Nodularia spumigena]MEA5612024.1 matrixin family metalloprotease [Nodularia spumigena UHCC 0040]
MIIDTEDNSKMLEVMADALAKVFSAFRSVNVFLTSDPPEEKEWGQNFTHIYVLVDQQPVDYLGIASFSHGQVTNIAAVRVDQILGASYLASLNLAQLSNLIANTIAHEIGHTLGLDHSHLPTDVMHDGLEHRIHSLMPPSFHAEQIILMNNAIRKYKS